MNDLPNLDGTRAESRGLPLSVHSAEAHAPDWEVPAYALDIFTPRKSDYAVIVPVWNEGIRLTQQLQDMQRWTEDCDIIISDKPSTDGSTNPELLANYGVHALITLREKGGLSSSLRCAFAHAMSSGYQGIVMMDGNNKDDPEAIPRFIASLKEGRDFVQGSRYVRGGHAVNTPLSRHLLITFIHAPLFSLICGQRFTDTTNGFRGFSRGFLSHPAVRPFRRAFDQYELPYYLAWASARRGQFTVVEIPVTRAYPESGPTPTKITLVRGYWRMLKPILMLLFRRY